MYPEKFKQIIMLNPSSSIYFNTSACGIVSPKVMESGFNFYTELSKNTSVAAERWRNEDAPRIRKNIANFLGVAPQNVAMIPNFSFGLISVIQSLKGTEKILMYKHDYPSLTDPLTLNNFDITWFDTEDEFQINLEEIKKSIIQNKIEILIISHVQWLSGFKVDLKKLSAICKETRTLLIVDGTQSMGAMPINLSELELDVFIASNYKWMNAGFGTGILYMNDAFLGKYPPKIGGYNSYIFQDNQLIYKPSIHSYEPGHLNMFGFNILDAAIEEKNKISLGNIEAQDMGLTQLMVSNLESFPQKIIGRYNIQHRSSIIFIKNENGLGNFLKERNVIVTHRKGYLRIGLHYYNTEEEVFLFLSYLKEFNQ